MQQNDKYDDSSNTPARRKSILKNNYLSINELEKKKAVDRIENEVNNSFKLTDKKEKIEVISATNTWDFSRMKELVNTIFEHDAYIASIMSVIIYCIFADDVRVGFLTTTWDLFIDIVLILSFLIFGAEFILSFIFKTNYLFTFYCYIDLLSFLSIILDIQLFLNPYNDYNTYRYK
jgi:hypothetical protein